MNIFAKDLAIFFQKKFPHLGENILKELVDIWLESQSNNETFDDISEASFIDFRQRLSDMNEELLVELIYDRTKKRGGRYYKWATSSNDFGLGLA